MLAEIENLLRVQHHDQRIHSLRKDLAKLPLEEEEARARLDDAKAQVESSRAALHESEIAVKGLEIDVQTRRDSIAKLKVQQFETRKNEEFQAMGKEIERYEAEIVALEDRELELMEEAEARRVALDEAKAALAENESDLADELEDLASMKAQIERSLESEAEARARLAAKVPEDLVELYGRIFKSKAGVAVVGLVDEVCQGCHMRVVKSTVVEVKREASVATCENCGRILYWWTDDAVGKNRGDY